MIHLSCLLFHALLWSPALVHARAVSCAASTWLGSHSTTASGADCYAVDSLSSPARNVTTPPSSAETVNFNKASRSHRVIQEELDTIGRRRVAAIISSVTQTSSITKWRSTLQPDGSWPESEVNYTSGCAARRANWPAQGHWQRIVTMAAAWHGELPGAELHSNDSSLLHTIFLAMDFWFTNDFRTPECLDSGGTPSCPCGTSGFWNGNWFSNVILIPEYVSQTCLVLGDALLERHLQHCISISERAYGAFDRHVNGLGYLTGANTLDVAKISIDLALLTGRVHIIADAYRRVHAEMVVEDAVKADGIRADGSFGQHAGILYNGNYGKDYTNDVLELELAAAGTQFSADETARSPFATLIEGDRWMIYRNSLTGVLHWDFSVLGRFISFPVIDDQATGSIKIDLERVKALGEQWHSDILRAFAQSSSEDTQDVNAGRLYGNRMFYANDYMVHRGKCYMTSVKMFSSRTVNTECTNSQNPFGFHLSDFATRTYLKGDEYEDIAASWDWDRIPGTTSDGSTPLSCNDTQHTGVEPFVGGVSDGEIGVATMRYTNPLTGTLQWQKALFFLHDDVQRYMISGLSNTNTSASVFSVLDQRRHDGEVFVDGVIDLATSSKRRVTHRDPKCLWHGGVGYTFEADAAMELTLKVGNDTGDWGSIGTSTQPPTIIDVFTASLEHRTLEPVAYTAYPGTSLAAFLDKSATTAAQTIRNDEHVSALLDRRRGTIMAVFWDRDGGSATFSPWSALLVPITLSSDSNAAVVYCVETGAVTVSDPSQMVTTVQLTFALGEGLVGDVWGIERTKTLTFVMPTGGLAGSSVTDFLRW